VAGCTCARGAPQVERKTQAAAARTRHPEARTGASIAKGKAIHVLRCAYDLCLRKGSRAKALNARPWAVRPYRRRPNVCARITHSSRRLLSDSRTNKPSLGTQSPSATHQPCHHSLEKTTKDKTNDQLALSATADARKPLTSTCIAATLVP